MKLQYTCLLLSGLLLAPLSLSLAHSITLDDAVGQVQEQGTGKILSARTESNEHGKRHIIRVLTPEGRIIPITIDAQEHKHELRHEK